MQFQKDISFTLPIRRFWHWHLLELSGRLDSSNAGDLLKDIYENLQAGDQVHWTLDLSQVEFLSVSCIREFVKMAQILRDRGGQLTLFRPSTQIIRHLETFLGDKIPIYWEMDQFRSGLEWRPRAEYINSI